MKRNDFEIEICAGNIQSVLEADKAGANRVELCDNLMEGGTTPSIGTIIQARKNASIDIFPIIRPRGGDFIFSIPEFEIMMIDIKQAVKNGADGFAIGCLKPDLTVDYEMCARLIDAAGGLPVTFHRAFDLTPEPFAALEVLKKLGVKRVLTSGQKNKAQQGIPLLKDLVYEAGGKIGIMVGSGIDEANIEQIAIETNAKMFHATLREEIEPKVGLHPDVRFMSCDNIPENTFKVSDSNKIKRIIKKLEEL